MRMKVKWIIRLIVLTAFVVFGSGWTYRYYHSTSWGAAEKIAIRYGMKHRLVKSPIQSFSMQSHHRWHGIWLERYYFFETPEKDPGSGFSMAQIPPFVEITVSGDAAKVVATDVSPRLKADYPVQGFGHH